MRKLGLLAGLMSLVLAGSVRAQDETPAPAPAAEVAPASAPMASAAGDESRIQVGIGFLPMLLGSLRTGPSSDNSGSDLAFAYGFGLSASYRIIAGLSVGIAPQLILHVKDKKLPDSQMEYDIMARIAYAYTVLPKFSVYAEVLPGYSIISLPSGMRYMGEKPPSPKGFVIGFGAGAAYDVTDMIFVNLGVGYQIGLQTMSVGGTDYVFKTKFLRIAVGGGVKF
jgi:opacity protein-like surface antigen